MMATAQEWFALADRAWESADPTRPKSTLRLFEAMVPFMPADDPAALYQLANAYFFADDSLAASIYLEAAIRHGLAEPERSLATVELIGSLYALGEDEAALERIAAVRTTPEAEPIRDWLSAYRVKILHRLGRDDVIINDALVALAPRLFGPQQVESAKDEPGHAAPAEHITRRARAHARSSENGNEPASDIARAGATPSGASVRRHGAHALPSASSTGDTKETDPEPLLSPRRTVPAPIPANVFPSGSEAQRTGSQMMPGAHETGQPPLTRASLRAQERRRQRNG